MQLRRLWALLLLAGITLLAAAPPAMAHVVLRSSNPAEGNTLSTAPSQIELTFDKNVTLPSEPITISGSDGVAWTLGTASASGTNVTAPVQAAGANGTYRLNYLVIGDDGHPVSGSVNFLLGEGGSLTGSSSASGWVWFLIAAVLGGIVLVFFMIRSRRSV
jgi:copper resistance protein C